MIFLVDINIFTFNLLDNNFQKIWICALIQLSEPISISVTNLP